MKHEEAKYQVHNKITWGFLACSLIASLCAGSSAIKAMQPQPVRVKVVVEKIERVSSNKAHFWLKVVNESANPVFLEGSPLLLSKGSFDMQEMEGLYLEQWRAKEGWTIVVPCRDTFASDPITLKPGKTMTQERVLELPLSAVCKKRNIQIEGRFRFRLDYFAGNKEVQTYIEQMNSLGHEPRPPLFAVSEPFEIPQPKRSKVELKEKQ